MCTKLWRPCTGVPRWGVLHGRHWLELTHISCQRVGNIFSKRSSLYRHISTITRQYHTWLNGQEGIANVSVSFCPGGALAPADTGPAAEPGSTPRCLWYVPTSRGYTPKQHQMKLTHFRRGSVCFACQLPTGVTCVHCACAGQRSLWSLACGAYEWSDCWYHPSLILCCSAGSSSSTLQSGGQGTVSLEHETMTATKRIPHRDKSAASAEVQAVSSLAAAAAVAAQVVWSCVVDFS